MALPADLIEEIVLVGGRDITIVRPRDTDALLDEHAFEHEELLPYWADLWPSAVLLAETVAARALRGRRVLELGCGLGVPAIAAALAGGRVTATDWSPAAVEAVAANAGRNGARVEALVCSWQEPDAIVSRAPWELVLAADVLYEHRNIGLLLDLLPRLTAGRGEIWLADPHRAFAETLLERARAAGWEPRTLASSASPLVTVHRLRPPAPGVDG
jgi:predicted nicotinamide N-methyase